ncbi:MAG TPA: heavy metal-binding domain-containing protein [Bdellovibrionota bacterium]|nr:heavy metal-binding domain-containing protein [Bdellovibrionota bacterium]
MLSPKKYPLFPQRWLAIGAVLLGIGFLAAPARAGNYGYFVTYNSEVEAGELELMFMNDLTQPSRFRREEGFGDYLSHMVELEYEVTSQFATEFMIEWFEDLDTGDHAFTGFRWENRYRLIKKRVPANPMVYVEYEDLDPATRYKMEVSGWVRSPYEENGEEPDRERIMETRLILSEDVGPVNVAFNWINETDVTSGTTAFGYSSGLFWMAHQGYDKASTKKEDSPDRDEYRCPMHSDVVQNTPGNCPKCGMALKHDSHSDDETEKDGGVGIGLELYGALGDTKSFGLAASRQEHYLGPILMYHFADHWMFHTQLAIGLTKASDNLVRLNFGYQF